MEYIVGEKFINHLKASDTHPELAHETLTFATEIKDMFQSWEIAEFFQTFNSNRVAAKNVDDGYAFEEGDAELLIAEAEQIVVMEKAKRMLIT
jgi:hypothetical protein